ncbi:MAG: putative ABC transporter permease [Peptostreptococcaceae bacterium]
MKSMVEIVIYFFIYSFFGWICESIYCSIGNKKLINRGFLNGPICPIYGFGALLIVYILANIENVAILFIYGVIVTSTLEFIGGYLLEKIFNARWWDYSNKKFNLRGRVCLKNSILFGVLCIALMKLIHPRVVDFVGDIPYTMLLIISIIIFILFLLDLSITINAINKLNHKLKGLDDIIFELSKVPEKLHEEFYRNKLHLIEEKSLLQRRIINAFPNMKHNTRHKQLLYVKKIIKRKFK